MHPLRGTDVRTTRDQLWALVEGPEHDAEARTRAARALARTHTPDESTRLRVAAAHCAEPRVRVLLEELAEEEEPEARTRAERHIDTQMRGVTAARP